VVPAVSVPQKLPVHPGPERVQERIVLGFDPGAGVRVAKIVAETSAGTLCGAINCSEKLLVMATATEVCFEGSATLCAVSMAFAGEGRTSGAM
jgi:hypothetical protein